MSYPFEATKLTFILLYEDVKMEDKVANIGAHRQLVAQHPSFSGIIIKVLTTFASE